VSDDRVRIGIVGAGAMGAEHAAAYAKIADVKVVGVCARNAARARSVAALCDAEPVADPAALIGDTAVDAIDVCVPSAVHHVVVIPALEQGKHVFCETPLALDLAHARQLVDVARRARRLLQVGLLMRSVSAYEHLNAAVASGAHGRLLSLATYRLGSYLRPGAPDHKAHYGDPSTELMTFDFDVVQWLMGPPARVAAGAVRLADGGPGEISALLSFDDGRHATVVAGGMMPSGFPFSVGVRALFERAAFELRTVFGAGPPQSSFTVVDGGAPPREVPTAARNPYQVELQRFADCVRGRADPRLLDAERAVEALILSVATQRALREARLIEIRTVR
jgi:predicted dehydrogenase